MVGLHTQIHSLDDCASLLFPGHRYELVVRRLPTSPEDYSHSSPSSSPFPLLDCLHLEPTGSGADPIPRRVGRIADHFQMPAETHRELANW